MPIQYDFACARKHIHYFMKNARILGFNFKTFAVKTQVHLHKFYHIFAIHTKSTRIRISNANHFIVKKSIKSYSKM